MSATVASELIALLTSEQSTLDQLKQVLQKESDALMEQDIHGIEHSAQDKHSLLSKFQQQVSSRLKYLSSQQYSPSEQGLSDFIASLPNQQNQDLQQQWEVIKEDFKELMSQNDRNGIIIQHRRQRTGALLNILHGNKNEPNLYNQSGSAKKSKQRHRLGEA